jgi:oxygen-independent coproporphyrinogen-3 oxidase
MTLACYVHVPFCAKICTYCDFYRLVYEPEWERRYVDAIAREIDLRAEIWHTSGVIAPDAELTSIYFGGGTPSILAVDSWNTIVARLRERFRFAPDIEFTSEANPESATMDKLTTLRQLGVNRLSFGAQSFAKENLERLGRVHSAAQVSVAVDNARTVGLDNYSLDLMFGLPDESDSSFAEDLRRVVRLEAQHISFYSLMLEGNVPLRYQVQRREVSLPGEEQVTERYQRAIAHFAAEGLPQYEISNFARPGRECRHNLAYWTGGDYLAFGPAAVGTIGEWRYKNEPDLLSYVRALSQNQLPPADVEELTPGKRLIETIMLSLRLTRGLAHGSLKAKYGYDLLSERRDLIGALERDGDVIVDNGCLCLTPSGMLRSDLIMSTLLPDFV